MTAGKKPKVSAKEVLSDIRSGVDQSELKRKYGLSDKGVESLFRKLVASGLVTDTEVRKRSRAVTDSAESTRDKPETPEWRCPACNAAQPKEVAECPACGVVVEKFLARRAEEAAVPEFGLATHSTISGYWLLAIGGILAVVLVGGVVLLWPEPKVTGKPKPSGIVEKIKRAVEPGQRIELKYSPKGFPMGLSVSEGFGLHLFETPSPDQGFKRMPPDTGAKRYYDQLSIAGRTFLVITEESEPPKIYLDANQNEDLTDDPGPFPGEKPNVLPNYYTLELPYEGEREPTPYRMWIFVSRMGGARFYPQCHWHQKVLIVGSIYELVLFDGNSDGDYSNDAVVIDVNNDGKASKSETVLVGQSIEVDGTAVKLVSIAPSGRWVRLDY